MKTIIYNGVTLKAVPGEGDEKSSCEGCYFNKPAGQQRCLIAAKDLARQCYPEANSGKWIIWTEVKAPT